MATRKSVIIESTVVSVGSAPVTGEVQKIAVPAPFRLKWDDEIKVAPLRNFKNQNIPGLAGVFHKESGEYLGHYSDARCVVPNTTLIGTFEEALNSAGLEYSRNIYTTGVAGAVMHALYTLTGGTSFKGPDGHEIATRIRLVNSYNCQFEVSAIVEGFRLICLNGAVGFGEVSAMFKRHEAGISATAIAKNLMASVETGRALLSDTFSRMGEFAVTHEQGGFILRNMFRKAPHKFSGLLARRIEENWNTPAADEQASHLTLWGLYNAATRYFRDLLREDSDKAMFLNRVEPHVAAVMRAFITDEKHRLALLAPVTFDEAYKREIDAA
jgi:hypothetical protein